MAEQFSRAKISSWLSVRLHGIRIVPSNPADIKGLAANAKLAEAKIRALSQIASESGWHADASLEYANELLAEYDAKYHPSADSNEPS